MDWTFLLVVLGAASVLGVACFILSFLLNLLGSKLDLSEKGETKVEPTKDQYPTDNKPIIPGR